MAAFFKSCLPIFKGQFDDGNLWMVASPRDNVEVEWKGWRPPKPGDVRSPCPALNALANHNILPHNGRNITKAMAVNALSSPQTIHLPAQIASVFASGGIAANPDHHAHHFDLDHVDKHGFIEHDASLSRNDAAFGSNSEFSHERWKQMFEMYAEGGNGQVNYTQASKARHFEYGITEAIMSYGETGLLLTVLGTEGVVPLEYLRVFFEEERLPYTEGWKPSPKPIEQSDMSKTISKLIAANEHKGEEAVEIGMGTVQALETAIGSLLKMPSMCSVM